MKKIFLTLIFSVALTTSSQAAEFDSFAGVRLGTDITKTMTECPPLDENKSLFAPREFGPCYYRNKKFPFPSPNTFSIQNVMVPLALDIEAQQEDDKLVTI